MYSFHFRSLFSVLMAEISNRCGVGPCGRQGPKEPNEPKEPEDFDRKTRRKGHHDKKQAVRDAAKATNKAWVAAHPFSWERGHALVRTGQKHANAFVNHPLVQVRPFLA